MKKAILAIAIIGMILLGLTIIPSTIGASSNYIGKTLYVGGSGPGNYTKIQDAIDNASTGDTVFVYDDSSPYCENVYINKSISLIGEDKNTTVIDGEESDGHVVSLFADGVTVTGFTIQNSGGISNDAGIYVISDNNNISGNNIICIPYHGDEGIWLWASSGNSLSGNTVSNYHYGIWFEDSSNNDISGNYITNNSDWGIILGDSFDNSITRNIVRSNYGGIYLRDSTNNNLCGNEISKNLVGIQLTDWETTSSNNKITRNNFRENIDKNAFFNVAKKSHGKNTWDENYWNRPLLLPKLILGAKKFIYFPGAPFHFPPFWICIPWINFDWRPAREPYEILSLGAI